MITGNDSPFVCSIVQQLSSMFFLKDMGQLHYFLGVEVFPTSQGLFLSQHQYIRNLLSKTNMSGAKDVSTPLSTSTSLKLVDGTATFDSTEFRRVIGSLQYLSLTRPDISFAVNKLSQFMHKPTHLHWTAAKRLLRYLKHIIFHGIHIWKTTAWNLTTYFDADWAITLMITLLPRPTSASWVTIPYLGAPRSKEQLSIVHRSRIQVPCKCCLGNTLAHTSPQ